MHDVALELPQRSSVQVTHRNALIGVWVAVAMVVAVPAVLIHSTPSTADSSWLAALLITVVSGARYAWIVGDGRRRLVEMSFWVFTYVFMGLAPMVQIRSGVYPVTTPRVDTSLNGLAATVVLVGIAAFVLGLMMPARRRGQAHTAVQVNGYRAVSLAVLALAVNAYYVSKLGVGLLFANRLDRDNMETIVWSDSSTYGIIAASASMSVVVAFVALVKYLQQAQKRSRAMIALTIIVGITLAATLNPISSARYIFGTAALAALASLGAFATRDRFRAIAVLAVVALVAVFPLLDAFRYTSNADFKVTDTFSALTSADFDSFEQINNTLLYVDRNGSTHGKQALGVILFAVPRRIWPDKASDTGVLLAEYRHFGNLNMSAPIWTELYINGMWVALIIGMFALGVIAKIADTRIEETLQHSRAPAILACVLPFYLLIVMRGSLLQAMSYLTVTIACSLFVSEWRKRTDGAN